MGLESQMEHKIENTPHLSLKIEENNLKTGYFFTKILIGKSTID
jgi:hypothetical protein